MKPPILSRPLTLEAAMRMPDGAGGYTTAWVAQGQLWAEVVAGAGRDVSAVGTVVSRIIHRITVRAAPVGAPSRPRAEQRFRDGTRVLKIISVTEADAGGRFLACQAEEETAA